MRQVCVLLHGIDADPKDRLWNEEVEARFQPLASTFGIELVARKYGYVQGLAVWFNALRRREIVDHEEAYFRGVYGEREGLFESITSNTKVHIVGHSLGSYIVTALLKRGMKFNGIVSLWGSTVENFDWYAVDKNFDKVRVYWSPNDEVLMASYVAADEDPELALGILGKIGPTIAHSRVEAIKTNWTHNQFMDNWQERDKLWEDIFRWLAEKV